MTEDETPAQVHLHAALEGLAEHCEPLADMQLKDWYVITTHTDADGEEVLSRFTRPKQMPWADRELLSFALESDRREWAEDDTPRPGDTYT